MSRKTPSIAIYDVGKTNKKLILFDEQYNVVHEESIQLAETKDEDGFSCEDVAALTTWIKTSFAEIQKDQRFDIKAVNFSGYGASFVYLDENKNVIPPLYNYLKPYTASLQKKFYQDHGGESHFSKITASPVLGNLNSGMQLYSLKHEKPELFKQIKYALHLPQYLSYILSSSLARITTEAPSLRVDALAAVTVPALSNTGPRVGIDYAAPADRLAPWRFWIKGDPFVSK